MTRKKVKLAWITNDSARKTSFRKRKEGLLKKLSELSILCDVSGFAIIYGPDDKEPVVWPSRPIAEELLARFQRIPEVDRCKKMMNQETYLDDRLAKLKEQLTKTHRKNKEMEMNIIMSQIQEGKPLNEFGTCELTCLVLFLEEKIKEIWKRIKYLGHEANLPLGAFSPHEGGDAENTTIPDEWNPTESLYNYFSKENGKQSQNMSVVTASISNVMGNMGLPPHASFGSTSGINVSKEMRLLSENFGMSRSSDIGFMYGNIKGDMSNVGSDFGTSFGRFGDRKYRNDIEWSYENLGASSDGSGIGLPHVNNGLLQTHYGNVNGSSSGNVRNDAEDIGGINGGYDNIEGHIPHPSNITGGFGSNIGVPHGAGSDTGLPNGLSGESNAGSDAGVLNDISKTRKRSFSP
ncbi:PREDICTED: agamous MADS-box [Prunus dulcis]|uniref:PREDICTED: agamous MADS-box n=2 Tax=Prunus dulcis TaxID=3755 RepID=A0A5E4FUX6_PRUDU|nr:agamous-like MADS-box protein AGL90 [Prunus dulcis]VVA31257.1 PREDICTED: agamous MADS-box [Prunus dulcis]